MRVDSLYVYPVKGLTAQPLQRVALTPGHGFPFDREFALARRDGKYYPGMPVGLPKTNFLMLMRDERLAEARTSFDPGTETLHAEHPGGELHADLTTEHGRVQAARFFAELAGVAPESAPRLAHDSGRRFTDLARRGDAEMHFISFVNIATIRDLEKRSGTRIDPLRFRANIYLDLGAPFVENDLVGAEFTVGEVRFHADRETTRCSATAVDPATGIRDLDVLRLLTQHHHRPVMGFYARTISGGAIERGDTVSMQEVTRD